jgi:hypothetical protein
MNHWLPNPDMEAQPAWELRQDGRGWRVIVCYYDDEAGRGYGFIGIIPDGRIVEAPTRLYPGEWDAKLAAEAWLASAQGRLN